MKRNTLIAIVIIVVGIFVAVVIRGKKEMPDAQSPQGPMTPMANTAIDITEEPIVGQYYTGTKAIIAGSGALADAARTYIDEAIGDFAATAAKEVPDRIRQFGKDAPAATYTIDLNAAVVNGQSTTAIVIDEYLYRGGANGMSTYKVLTASIVSGKILAIADIIMDGQQDAFVTFVKDQLLNWKNGGVFPEEVQALTIDSLNNWSLDQQGTLTVYFDKYEVGPGALGAVAFPLSAEKIRPYLVPLF